VSADDPKLFHDFPISMQLVGKHWQDELLLGAAMSIEQILRP
jgi:Asp-tRNA(Asn)/Glu-tRNA(Gln) amidotransferase A subunit family amidase